MKKILFVYLFTIAGLSACKKEIIKPTDIIPSVTVTSANDAIYHPNGSIVLTWKTKNIPLGAIITVQINNIANGYGISPVYPENELNIQLVGATTNDGNEKFFLPGSTGNKDIYLKMGDNFQLLMTVHYPDKNGNWSAGLYTQAKSNILTIVPGGCNSTEGYSTTTGRSCSIPFP